MTSTLPSCGASRRVRSLAPYGAWALVLATAGCADNPAMGTPVAAPSAPAIHVSVAPGSAIAEEALPVRSALRSAPATLTGAEAEAAVVAGGFYCKGWNSTGRGAAHQYELRVLAGAVVVTDGATGLMWQRPEKTHVTRARADVDDYVDRLNAAGLAGFHDWRLPTLVEAMSLMTDDAHGEPMEIIGPEEEEMHGILHVDPILEMRAAPFIWTADFTAAAANEGDDPRVRRGWQVAFIYAQALVRQFSDAAFVVAVRSM